MTAYHRQFGEAAASAMAHNIRLAATAADTRPIKETHMLSLTKDQPEALTGTTNLRVGAAWDTSGGGKKGLGGFVRRQRGTGLDLVCVALAAGDPKRLCWFDNPDPFKNGSLLTSGNACITAKATRNGTGWDIAVVNAMENASDKGQLLQLGVRYAS